jgi:hypothetical protein
VVDAGCHCAEKRNPPGIPRATGLCKMSEAPGIRAGQTHWFEISKKIQDLIIREKKVNANVDFYSASAYCGLGIPVDLYPMVFALTAFPARPRMSLNNTPATGSSARWRNTRDRKP